MEKIISIPAPIPAKFSQPFIRSRRSLGVLRTGCGLGILLALSHALSAQSGIVVWKEQPFHKDSSALAMNYDRMQAAGPYVQFTGKGQVLSFPEGKFYREIPFPSNVITFTEQADYLEMQRSYRKLTAFSKQYANAAPLLAPRLERMAGILKGYEDGKVYYNGQWMPRAQYVGLSAAGQKADTASRQDRIKKENDKRKMILGGVGGFAVLLILAGVLRKWKFVGFLLLFPLVGAAWLTYEENGYRWLRTIPDFLKLPTDLEPIIQEAMKKLMPGK